MALTKKDLWSIVSETKESPGEGAITTIVAKYRARKDWALAMIVLSIELSLLYLLGDDPKKPVDVWNKLKGQFQKKNWAISSETIFPTLKGRRVSPGPP